MSAQEKKVLSCILTDYFREKPPFYLSKPFKLLAWIALVAITFAMKRLLETDSVNIYFAEFILVIIGVHVGVFVMAETGYKNQALIKPYLDVESIKRRLAELEKN